MVPDTASKTPPASQAPAPQQAPDPQALAQAAPTERALTHVGPTRPLAPPTGQSGAYPAAPAGSRSDTGTPPMAGSRPRSPAGAELAEEDDTRQPSDGGEAAPPVAPVPPSGVHPAGPAPAASQNGPGPGVGPRERAPAGYARAG